MRSQTCFGEPALKALKAALHRQKVIRSKTFILTDDNTRLHCLPVLLNLLPGWQPDGVFSILPGEPSKTLSEAGRLMQELAAAGADRHTLFICLGGGVVTDLGGFTASCFKRGIPFIHIPTTLMGMADASIGGKTAVDIDSLKNQAGTFTLPQLVVIHPVFLKTLDPLHLRSGLAEAVKAALIADPVAWRKLQAGDPQVLTALPPENPFWKQMILLSVRVKHRIVARDPEERKERELLNFGHTFGHAYESLMLRYGTPVPHGDAVAFGMVCETYLSGLLLGLPPEERNRIAAWLIRGFGKRILAHEGITELVALLSSDKKNRTGVLLFTGLAAFGQGRIRVPYSREQAMLALQWYRDKAGV